MLAIVMAVSTACGGKKEESQSEAAPQEENAEPEKESTEAAEVTKENFRSFPATDESVFSIKTEGDKAEIEGCKRDIPDKVIVVPETISGYKVVSVGFGAFTEMENVEAIVLPDSVESIGKSAFTTCEKLRFVYLGSGLKSTGDTMFNYCNALKEIELPDGTTTMNGCIAGRCSGLEIITIPASVQEIQYGIISPQEFSGVIRTPAGSVAEKNAQELGLKVENY